MAHRASIAPGGLAWPARATPSRGTCAPPLPARPVVVLRFALPRAEQAGVVVLDAAGRVTRTLLAGRLAAGEHACCWDGRDDRQAPSPSGDYTLRLVVEDQVVTARRVTIG